MGSRYIDASRRILERRCANARKLLKQLGRRPYAFPTYPMARLNSSPTARRRYFQETTPEYLSD